MAFRRMTRSLSKTHLPEQQIQSPQTSISIKNKNRNKRNTQSTCTTSHQIESEEMDFLLVGDQQLESALNSGPDFIPECFLSQPRVDVSSQLSQNGLTFESDLLLACDSDIVNDDWKYSNDINNSQPGTQLDMVNGIDQVMDYPSALYSPASSSSVTPATDMTTAERLLQMYLPSSSPAPVISPLSDDCDDIPDEDLLNDLDSILSSYEGPETTSDSFKVEYNPPADTLALALCSQYEPGIHVIEDYSQSSAGDEEEDDEEEEPAVTETVTEEPVAGPSRRGRKPAAAKSSPPAPASRRGRKRKASSSDSDSADSRKKKQNAAAAKNYRKRKAELMNKVFEEKKKVEEELDKARKKLMGKLNERNILLKMLYESYKENADSSPKILFPDWFDSWYHNQKDE